MAPGAWAIETEGLTRTFGRVRAVDDLRLAVPPGSIFGFLGPNGAGKTTTIKLLTGLLAPTAGTARVLGFDIGRDPVEVRKRIGVVPEGLNLYERLTAHEHLELVGRLHGLSRAEIRSRGAELLELLDLVPQADGVIVDYSHGMKKKVSLATALLHTPELLFLDEPFEGIDPVAARGIKDLLMQMVARRGVTVFFSTHIMELAERFCDWVGIIDHGRLIAAGRLDELRQRAGLPAGASLEDAFLHLVGRRAGTEGLEWLTHGT